MKIERKDTKFEMTVSRDELHIIVACMNEALEIVEPFEFQTRTGFERHSVELMIEELVDTLRKS